MEFIIIFSILVIAVNAVFLVNDWYVFVFLHKDWKLWHEIWNNIDTFEPLGDRGLICGYFVSDKFPDKMLVVFSKEKSAFWDTPTDECELCSFYEKYSKKCATYLTNKYK